MTDPLRSVCERWELPDPVFGADELAGWPAGAVEALASTGILAETTAATSVRCDACEQDHVERVIPLDTLGRPRRWFLRCPDSGRVTVDPFRLRRWVVQGDRFAARVADAAGVAGGVVELVPGRAWRLGKLSVAGRPRVILLCRGLTWSDGGGLVARVPALGSPATVLLVPAVMPVRAAWGAGTMPPVVLLTDLLTLSGPGLAFDRDLLTDSLSAGGRPPVKSATVRFPTPAGATWADLTLQVGAEHLTATVGAVTKTHTFAEVGFADLRREHAPDKVWALLRLFAIHFGTLPSRPGGAAGVQGAVKQTVLDLSRRLRNLFHLDGRPFQHVSRVKEYRTRFHITPLGKMKFPVPPGCGWEHLTLTEIEPGALEITVEHPAGADAGWSRRVYFRAVGLADEHDTPTPVGRTLKDVLRNSGRVRVTAGDGDLLRLNRWLSDSFQLPAPFDVRSAGRLWVTRFTAASRFGSDGQN